jgi:putative FmdB family regulatory protein
MPIYEYRCEECDEQFQLFVRSLSRQVEPTCPRCGSHKVKKAISLFGLGKPGAGATMSASCDTGST